MIFKIRVSKSYDGSLKVYIEELQLSTWASDMDDVKEAVEEAVECYKISSENNF